MEKRIDLRRSNVVGVIHTAGGFGDAGNPSLDAVEVRVDALPKLPSLQQVEALSVPAILTVRRLDEGGARPISDEADTKATAIAAAIRVPVRYRNRISR